MTTFIKTKFNKSDDQIYIHKYRVAIISKLIFRRIIMPKFFKIRKLFHVKKICLKMFKIDVWTFCSQLSNGCAFYIGTV